MNLAHVLAAVPPWLWLLIRVSLGAGLIGGAVLVAMEVFRIRQAVTRHALWSAVLVSFVALPGLALVLPAWELRLLPPPAEPAPAVDTAPVVEPARIGAPPQGLPPSDGRPEHSSAAPAAALEPQPSKPAPRWRWPRWQTFALIVYLVGVLVALGRLLRSAVAMRRLVARAAPVDDGSTAALATRVALDLCLGRVPEVFASSEVWVPAVVGVLRSRLLLPEGFASQGHTDQLRAVLIHEFAHIKRRDGLKHLLGLLVRAAYFFHPVAWYASAQAANEREHICDDYVLSMIPHRAAYAEQLLHLAAVTRRPWPAAVLGVPIVRRCHVEHRINLILDTTRQVRLRLRGRTARAIVYAATIVLFLAGSLRLAARASPSPREAATPDDESWTALVASQMTEAEREAEVSVQGKIVAGHGRRLPEEVQVVVSSEKGMWQQHVCRPAQNDGRFSVDIAWGRVTVLVKAKGCAPALLGPWNLRSGQNLTGLQVRLQPGFDGSLRFTSPGGSRPASGVVEVSLAGKGQGRVQIGPEGEATVADCGSLPVDLEVTAGGFEHTWFKSVRFHPSGVTSLELKPGSRSAGRAMSRASGSPIGGAAVRILEGYAAFGNLGPGRMGGVAGLIGSGEAWAVSGPAGRIALTSLRAGWVYWVCVEANGHAAAIVGPFLAGTDFGDVLLGPPLQVSGEIHAPADALKRVCATWDQRVEFRYLDKLSISTSVHHGSLDTAVKDGRIPFSITNLIPGEFSLFVDYRTSGLRSRRFTTTLTQSIKGLIITPEGVRIETPATSAAASSPLVIDVRADGSVVVDNEIVDVKGLTARMRRERDRLRQVGREGDLMVVVRADPGTPYSHVQKVITEAARLDIERIAFQTAPGLGASPYPDPLPTGGGDH